MYTYITLLLYSYPPPPVATFFLDGHSYVHFKAMSQKAEEERVASEAQAAILRANSAEDYDLADADASASVGSNELLEAQAAILRSDSAEDHDLAESSLLAPNSSTSTSTRSVVWGDAAKPDGRGPAHSSAAAAAAAAAMSSLRLSLFQSHAPWSLSSLHQLLLVDANGRLGDESFKNAAVTLLGVAGGDEVRLPDGITSIGTLTNWCFYFIYPRRYI